ncbi:cytochrome P450 [Hypoxylon crocopeplum]|nr:cytochrome P450 [Hypoxylon crocopeplum]
MSSLGFFPTLLAYAIYIIIPWFLLLCIFRLLLHPLRGYPGPFFARLTDAYGGYCAMRKCLHLTTYENFKKYGPVVRQAPNRLIFNTATALHDIYLNPRLRAEYPSMVNVIDHTQHQRKRKFIGQILTGARCIEIFLRLLLKSCPSGSPVDMTERRQRLGLDVIGLLAFGHPFGTQTSEEFLFLPPVLDAMGWRINTYMQFPPLSRLEPILALLGFRRAVQFRSAVQTMIQTRIAKDKNAHHDLYSVVADHIGKGQQGLYHGELWPEASLFIMAGGTTTATTMSALFFYLSRNPACYATLAAEVRSSFGSASDIHAGPQLNGCKYLRACIDETLRMSPPSPTSPWREQDAADDSGEPFVVDGHVIPRGTQVSVNLFKPERWLDPDPDPPTEDGPDEGLVARKRETYARANMRKAFVPFLIGDRACAGRSMAYMEASLTIAHTLWFFDFEAAPGKAGEVGGGKEGLTDGRGRPGEYQLDDIFAAGHRGPNLVFRKRGDFWKELGADG